MKVNPKETLIGWGLFLIALPVMSIFAAGYLMFAEMLDGLITGKGSVDIGGIIISFAIMAGYAFVCFRLKKETLYVGTIIFCGVMLLCNDGSIITKIIMIPISLAILIIPFRLTDPARAARKAPRKTIVKYDKHRLPPEQEKRYRATLAKLPSNRAAFQLFCAKQPKGEVERLGRDLPTLLFHYVPCREALEYIYSQNPDNAMLMVDLFIKFDEHGCLIQN